MNSVLGDVVMPNLTSTYGVSLRKCIDGAAGAARSAVAGGESIRWLHSQGCANNSRLSTISGTVAVADQMIRSTFPNDKDDDTLLFGNNLRDTWRKLRPLFRK